MKATSDIRTLVLAINSKLDQITSLKESISLIEECNFNEDGTYNMNNVGIYLEESKKLNINNGALKRMIQNLFDAYYGGGVNWLRGKMTHEYINEFVKTFGNYSN